MAAGGREKEALEDLCRGYWYPVYAFIRRRGHPPDEAQDLTQEFFLGVLSGTFFERADPGKGRFRGFLLGAVKNFLADSRDRERSLKRGGGAVFLPFDFDGGESNYLREPKETDAPDRIFERKWAQAVLDRVMVHLRDESRRDGNSAHFERLKGFLTGSAGAKYAETAKELQMSESALKSAIHRLRARHRNLLRAEVSSTVADPAEVDEELRFLLQALSAPRREAPQ